MCQALFGMLKLEPQMRQSLLENSRLLTTNKQTMVNFRCGYMPWVIAAGAGGGSILDRPVRERLSDEGTCK